MKIPENLKYTKTDEWVRLEGNLAIIGISDYAQDQLSDIVYVEFNKDPGEVVKKEDILATIESVKAAGDVISPVSGIVKEVNTVLSEKPELLNDDPCEKGWMCKIEMSNPADFESLMSAEEYEAHCDGRH